ncbi:MAG: GH36-type glycosyl hydrolase domain-containing protein [Acetivibrionales bacterium]|jgi:cellobiose phosphorylase
MRYGYFDEVANEYVITRPDTPTPWINYIGSGKYGGIVSNTGGGYSFHKDPQNRRITRYRYNSIPMDRPGRYIYIKDPVTGEYWNPGFQPSGTKLDSYCCRHGMGYTVLEGEFKGIAASLVYFVPDDRDFEIWLLKVTNTLNTTKKLLIFSCAEFCFWDAIMDQQNVDWVQQINQCRHHNGIITWYPHFADKSASFFATSGEVKNFDTNLETFIGKYRSEANPIAVEQGACSNSISYRTNGVGAFCNEIEIGRGESKELVFILGYAENRDEIRKEIQPYLDPAEAHAALDRLNNYWKEYIGKLHVDTPDRDMNLFVNMWNQYQCKTTFNWSRFVSLYQLGLGRGMGIRDSAQDTLGVMHTIPYQARDLIVKLLQCQYTDGRAYHLFFPLTGEGGAGDAPIKKYDWYSDDHLWLILAVNAYLKETGDFGFLETEVLYNDKKTKGTVWEHLDKALDFTNSNKGPHGIALAGRADWNDTLNLDMGKGIAESVFTSMLFCRAALEMAELSGFLGRKPDEAKYKGLYESMKEAINASCWDGEWYKRAFDDEGKPIGSKENPFGKIFINSQSWAILGGISDMERSRICLDSVKKHLNTRYGITAMYPAYTKFDETKGGITTFYPGAKENGGIFCHTNPWVMIAETMMGNGEQAYEYYIQILPARRNDEAEILEVEPYVYCQNILGKEHPQFGTGRNSWLSGTAAWNLVAASQYILGIRPGYDCLIADPCIPPSWDGFRAYRVFRGAEHRIEIRNPAHVSRGVKRITVNGKEVEKIPVLPSGSSAEVVVELG